MCGGGCYEGDGGIMRRVLNRMPCGYGAVLYKC